MRSLVCITGSAAIDMRTSMAKMPRLCVLLLNCFSNGKALPMRVLLRYNFTKVDKE